MKQKSVKSRMFTSYLLILIIPSLIGLFGYAWSARIVRDNAEKTYSRLLDQARVQVEQNIQDMDRVVTTLATAQWLKEITYMNGPTINRNLVSITQLADDASQLQNYLAISSFYDRIALVFNSKDTVMTNGAIETIPWFFTYAYKSTAYAPEDLIGMLDVYTDGTFLQVDDVATSAASAQFPNFVNTRLLTYVRSVPSIDHVPRTTLLISIREDVLLTLLAPVSDIEGACVFVVDKSGHIVMGSEAGTPAYAAVKKLLIGRAAKTPQFVDTTDGRRMLVFRSGPSMETGPWTYVALIPENIVLSQVNGILYFTLAILAVSLLIGLLISYGLLRRNYAPLSLILKRVQTVAGPSGPDDAPGDEYGQIESAIDALARNQGDLEEKMGRFVPLAVHGFFLRLLYGNLQADEIDTVENSLGIGIDSGPWTAAVIGLEDMKDSSSGIHRKVSQWETEDNRPIYTVETDQGRIAILMFTDSEKVILEVIDRMCKPAAGMGNSGRCAQSGVGNSCASLREIGSSYREAIMAIHYAQSVPDASSRPVFFSEINKDGRLEYNFPSVMEDELRNRLRMGDRVRVFAILDDLAERNQHSLGTSLFTAHCFYYDLLSNALKVISESGISILDNASERHFMLMESVPDMKRFVYDVYAKVCAAMGTQREGRRVRNRTDILEYMGSSLNDENLTLASLADRYDVSVPYLSKFIKDQTGENFVDYIARKRVANAKQLLATTPFSIEEIGRRVGYTNPLTFRRAFRKVEGVTPGDFRDASRANHSA